ncbi:MAG: Gfo/Idh/MocA family oxidoreductase [Planctomycetaceae bacterium]|nr:Gfo/Idh/MocA family oxidoreductase [Planctomycetaceae bacterium]
MIRLGIVDFDTSHAIEFTRRINHHGVSSDQWVDGARVVAGCPGMSNMSPDRVAQYTPLVAECGVELVTSPKQLLGHVDAILILSLCGAAHLNHARLFLEHQIPCFIDKPFATTWHDAATMMQLSADHQTLLWHASALRYSDDLTALRARTPQLGDCLGCVSFGPAWHASGNPGLLHYGIHATELLYALLGPGCQQVTMTSTENVDVVTGIWNDGRIGTLRGLRHGCTVYGVTLFTERATVPQWISTRNAYRNLCRQIVGSFQHRQAPVPPQETLEVIRFLLAAHESSRCGGVPVDLASVPQFPSS